jgi:hypothetical protein
MAPSASYSSCVPTVSSFVRVVMTNCPASWHSELRASPLAGHHTHTHTYTHTYTHIHIHTYTYTYTEGQHGSCASGEKGQHMDTGIQRTTPPQRPRMQRSWTCCAAQPSPQSSPMTHPRRCRRLRSRQRRSC